MVNVRRPWRVQQEDQHVALDAAYSIYFCSIVPSVSGAGV
jgi:hypothetical protein